MYLLKKTQHDRSETSVSTARHRILIGSIEAPKFVHSVAQFEGLSMQQHRHPASWWQNHSPRQPGQLCQNPVKHTKLRNFRISPGKSALTCPSNPSFKNTSPLHVATVGLHWSIWIQAHFTRALATSVPALKSGTCTEFSTVGGKRPILPVGSKKDHQKLHSSCHWKHNQVIFHRLTAARLSALPPLFSCYFVRVGGDINGNRSDDEHRLEWSKTDGRLHDMGSPPDRNHSEMMLLKNPLATICKQLSDQVLAK